MNKYSIFLKKHLWYCLFLIIIIILFAYINSSKALENFTPIIRETYRPYLRKMRKVYNELYDSTTVKFSNYFKRNKLF